MFEYYSDTSTICLSFDMTAVACIMEFLDTDRAPCCYSAMQAMQPRVWCISTVEIFYLNRVIELRKQILSWNG